MYTEFSHAWFATIRVIGEKSLNIALLHFYLFITMHKVNGIIICHHANPHKLGIHKQNVLIYVRTQSLELCFSMQDS